MESEADAMTLDPLESLWADRMPLEHPMPARVERVRHAKPKPPVLRHAVSGNVGKLPPVEDQESTENIFIDSLPSWC
jgi:hypothetical protein